MIVKTSIKWGIYLGIFVVTGTQILTWIGLGLTNWFVGLSYLGVLIFVALGLRNIKALNQGKLSFPNALLAILIIILISTIIF